jgi:hypothetical protein
MTPGFFRKIFEKYLNFKFHENSSSGRRIVSCGRTDTIKLIVAIHNFARAPKMTGIWRDIKSPSFAYSADVHICDLTEEAQEKTMVRGDWNHLGKSVPPPEFSHILAAETFSDVFLIHFILPLPLLGLFHMKQIMAFGRFYVPYCAPHKPLQVVKHALYLARYFYVFHTPFM